MKTNVYIIEPFTNMHVGSGKENSGIVDNVVQKDVISGYPVINSTSLKGALREYFKEIKYKDESEKDDVIKHIFGKGNEKKNGQEENKGINIPGKFCFFNANLLSMPARSDKFSFIYATTGGIIRDFLQQVDLMQARPGTIIDAESYAAFKKLTYYDCNEKALCFDEALKGAIVEYYDAKAHYCNDAKITAAEMELLKKWLGGSFVLVNETFFKENMTGKLPVIARNHLDNGQSTNLWYEEIVPRKTRFYTFIASAEKNWNSQTDFNIKPIQIGANSSVGYGYSKIECMTTKCMTTNGKERQS